jgi:Methionyl-tRNA formyltransferase
LPNFFFALPNKDNSLLPVFIKSSDFSNKSQKIEIKNDCWSEVNNNLSEPIIETMKNSSIKFEELKSTNLHDDSVIESIGSRSESTFIYSGYGGVILRKELFNTGKNFLHIHGGYIPDFKGSTTNYYSLISDDKIGASSLFLNLEIDSGPILQRKIFPPPKDRTQIDHIYDSAARAKVLIETLREYENIGKFQSDNSLDKGETYYIIHPVLKHIAILSKHE